MTQSRLWTCRVSLGLTLAMLSVTAVAQTARYQLPPGQTTNAHLKIGNDALSTSDLNTQTIAQVVQALIGGGVNVSNITYNGVNVAAGTFSGGLGIIGFDNGIVLSSGNIGSVDGPNTADNITTNNGQPGDPQLTTLAGFATFDRTVLEFDFDCPGATQISFQYVFTSDEYNEFVNTGFNDAFGFFLNGTNIATLPGGAPTTINNVNCNNPFNPPTGSNCALYINNDCSDIGGGGFPCPGNVDTEMDGLTVVLTASGTLLPGTNHIKLAIADAGDSAFDSNVFIRGQSFSCAAPAPFFNPPSPCGQTLNVNVGAPLNYTVSATAATGFPGNQVTLSVTNAPAGLTHAPALPLSASGQNATATTNASWTPTNAQIGTYVFNYTATDQLNQTATCQVTIIVSECYLLLGDAPLNVIIPGSNGDRLLVDPFWVVPVTMESIPSWLIPPQIYGWTGYAQVVMLNPLIFPNDPIRSSNGLSVTFGLGWSSYGPTTGGMTAWLDQQPLVGNMLDFGFLIQGF